MIYEVAIGDRVRTVGIVRKGGLLHVELDGRLHIVDARRVNDSIVSMLVQLDGAAGPRDRLTRRLPPMRLAPLAQGQRNRLPVISTSTSTVGPSRSRSARPARSDVRKRQVAAPAGSGLQRVTSPMPGKVVRLLVKAGDEVKARQGLVVVEAMKMENELRAARDGRVREVSVAEGQSVDAGTLLLIVE